MEGQDTFENILANGSLVEFSFEREKVDGNLKGVRTTDKDVVVQEGFEHGGFQQFLGLVERGA